MARGDGGETGGGDHTLASPDGAGFPISESAVSSEIASDEESRHLLGVSDIERLLEQGEHQKVVDLLGPPDKAAALPPRLALLYIAARGETGHGAELADLPHLAMSTSGRLLDMPARSHVARLVAKRLLGLSMPVVRSRMAGRRISILVTMVVMGMGLGYLLAYLTLPM